MRRRHLLASIPAASVAGIAGCFDREYDGTDANGPPRLAVDGRWTVDPDGNPVVLRGVSVADPVRGVENADERGKDYWETLRLATDEDEGWYARVLRVPVDPRSIRSVGLEAVVEEYLDRAVELGAEQGVYVLIDYHANERYDTPSIDRRLRAFWDAVAPRYADESHVLYELFSDPTEPAVGGVEAWRTWREYADPWISTVRDHAPHTPIVVGSPAWSSMTGYAAEDPFEYDDLLYSAHVYPSWEPRSWASVFGTPAFEVPVFVSEWGYASGRADGAMDHLRGTTDEWGEPFRAWLDAHENVHWCVATFDSRRRPAMFDDEWELLGSDQAGPLAKEWLADRRDDHQPGGSMPIPSEPMEPPLPPEGVGLVENGETSATIRWDGTEEPYDGGILQYRVYVDDREPDVLRGVDRSIELRGLDPNRMYEISVTAVDAFGRESEPTTFSFRTVVQDQPELVIPQASSAPEIDTIDDWWEEEQLHTVDRYIWGEIPNELYVEWRAVWDYDALYVFAEVGEADGGESNLEVFLDPHNTRAESYDEVESALHLSVMRHGLYVGPNSSDPSEGTTAERVVVEDGWRTLLTVPWDGYDMEPFTGHQFGLDVHAGPRSESETLGKITWYDRTGDAWLDPSRLATVELGE